ncbi:MAG: hypothetical protein KAG18_08245 [Sinobacterium sp.]|nr:hypothetical protein [Sinobacterium sp.]
MSMPTDQELDSALTKAKEMREQGEDDDFIAKAFLSHHYRLVRLEHVMEAAGHFLHSGSAPREHQLLIKAIDEAKAAEYRPGQARDDGQSVVI